MTFRFGSVLAILLGTALSLCLSASDKSVVSLQVPQAKTLTPSGRLSSVVVNITTPTSTHPLFTQSPRASTRASTVSSSQSTFAAYEEAERDLESGLEYRDDEKKKELKRDSQPEMELGSIGEPRQAAGSVPARIRTLTRWEAITVRAGNWRKKTGKRLKEMPWQKYGSDALAIADMGANAIAALTSINLLYKDTKNSDSGFLPDALDQADAALTLAWVAQALPRTIYYQMKKLSADCCQN